MTNTNKTRTGTATISKGRLLQLLAEEIGLDSREGFNEELGLSIDLSAIWSGSMIDEIHAHGDGSLTVEYTTFYREIHPTEGYGELIEGDPLALVEGDMVDTAGWWGTEVEPGDPLDETEDRTLEISAETEYAVVTGIEVETDDCVRIDFENFPSMGWRIGTPVKVALK